MEFEEALRQAQELGYAEPDPTNDVEGFDSTYKLAILASLAFHTSVHPTRSTARASPALAAAISAMPRSWAMPSSFWP